MKAVITIIILVMGLSFFEMVFAGDDTRRNQLVSITDEELSTLNGMVSKPPGSQNPLLFLRMAELYLEKARLVKDEEMQGFMGQSEDARRRIDKTRWFAKSRKYFLQAQKICIVILKRFPQTQTRAEVYYIMGANEIEFQNATKAKQYFSQALQGSTNNTSLRNRVKLSLAELYYNDGEFKKAIALYEQALSGKRDKWWTKDTYNLAWSYFKEGRHDIAIDKMKEVVSRSKNSEYVDISDRAMKDLGIFAATAGRVEEAEQFIDKSGGDVGYELFKMGKHQLSYGRYSLAEQTFIKALARVKSDEQKIDIQAELLKLYDRAGKYAQHLNIAEAMLEPYKAGKLNPEQKADYETQIKKMAAVLQNQVVGKTYVHNKKVRNTKATQAVTYLNLMRVLDSKNEYMHNFAAGETLFAVARYVEAIEYYDMSQRLSAQSGNKKIEKESLRGLMVSLEQKNIPKEVKDKYTRQVMEYFLQNDPHSTGAYKIYQRLFSEYMEKGQIKEAEDTLIRFKKYFSRDQIKQEAMLAKIMDYYQKKSDKANYSKWVERIRQKEFEVSPKYARQLNRILLAMQFENVQGLVTQGDKKKALEAYVQIYKDPDTADDAKKNAAYNIMLLFHELRNAPLTYGWAIRALNIMSVQDVLRFETSFLTIAGEFFNRRYYNESSSLYEKTLMKICNQRSNQKAVLFKNAVIIYLADQKVEEARNVIRQSTLCGISNSLVDEMELDILKSLIELKRWNSVDDQISKLEKNKNMWPELIVPIYQLRDELIKNGKMSVARKLRNKIDKFYNGISNKKMISLAALDIIAHFKISDLNSDVENFNRIQLSFPEDRYNQQLKKKFALLDKLTTTALSILSIGSGKALVRIYRVLMECYQVIAKEMRAFVPPGKSPEYVQSFNRTMVKISEPVLAKVEEYRVEAIKQITKNKILSKENYVFLLENPVPIRIEYGYTPGGVLMDRGGRR